MPEHANHPDRKTLDVVAHLLGAGKTDTLFRDLYLDRARELFHATLPYHEYLGLTGDMTVIDGLLRQSRAAVEREDWPGIRALAGRIRAMRQAFDGKHSLLILGRDVYEPDAVLINPMSPSLQKMNAVPDGRPGQACARAIRELSALEREDPAWCGFYAGRRAHFQAISNGLGSEPSVEKFDPHLVRLEALEASKQGNIDLLDALAKRMLDSRAETSRPGPAARDAPAECAELSAPFPAKAVANARKWGFGSARLSTAPLVERFLRRVDRQPESPDPPAELRPLSEALDFIAACPLITSGGARYRPALVEEDVLVEDFPEGGSSPAESELLPTLGIRGRRAVCRLDIERALLQNGLRFLKVRLELDPREFRLVCIPADVYARLGENRQWGRLEGLWTHFDGYQVLPGGILRALVGGDARFGGIHDLCSISARDPREGVTLRLAVVRRSRLMTRYI